MARLTGRSISTRRKSWLNLFQERCIRNIDDDMNGMGGEIYRLMSEPVSVLERNDMGALISTLTDVQENLISKTYLMTAFRILV